MLYQLSNGKVIYLTIEQYLELTDLDIQQLIAMDAGDFAPNPFHDSAINNKTIEKEYDFSYIADDDKEEINNIKSEDLSIDDIIDLNDSLQN